MVLFRVGRNMFVVAFAVFSRGGGPVLAAFFQSRKIKFWGMLRLGQKSKMHSAICLCTLEAQVLTSLTRSNHKACGTPPEAPQGLTGEGP